MKRASTLILLVVLLWPAVVRADVVVTRDGRTLEGVIVEESPDRVVLEMESASGKVRTPIARKDIVSIQRRATAREEYEPRRSALRVEDFRGHLDLARWCAENYLKTEAATHLLHIVRDKAKPVEATEARLQLVKLGYREFPREGWLTEDEFWMPKGFQRWKGAWVTREFAAAEEQSLRVGDELEKMRKRIAGRADTVGGKSAEYDKLAAEWQRWKEKVDVLEKKIEAGLDDAMVLVERTNCRTVKREDVFGMGLDLKGHWYRADGTFLVAQTASDASIWDQFRKIQKDLRATDKERQPIIVRMNQLLAKMDKLAAAAKKRQAGSENLEQEEARLEQELAEAQARRQTAKAAMDARLGPDGLPRPTDPEGEGGAQEGKEPGGK